MGRSKTAAIPITLERQSDAEGMVILETWSRSGMGAYRLELDTEFHTSTCTCEAGLAGHLCDHQVAAITEVYWERAITALVRASDRELAYESSRYIKAVCRYRQEAEALVGKHDKRGRKAARGREARAAAWMTACGDEIARRTAVAVAA